MNKIRTTQANPSPDLIDFGIGQPASDLLPLALVRDAAAMRLAADDVSLLHYGYELGDGYFRQALAQFLQQNYQTAVADERLMVTSGASQALDLICTRFTEPGDVVFVEEPSYFLALRIFEDHHLRLVGIPVDEDGLDVDALAAALSVQRPVFLYTIPTFQNPTGVTMSQERRQRLVELSLAHDFLLVADEVYHLLAYGNTPPAPFAAAVDNEHVLSVGSFSKILAPGLRLGWIQGADSLLRRLTSSGLVDSGGGLNPFTSNVIRVALQQGWQAAHLAFLKDVYQKRAAVMELALAEYLDGAATYTAPAGGFFFWLTLAREINTADLLLAARENQVGFQPGMKFSSRGAQVNCLRLSFAYYNEDEIIKGIKRLSKTVAGWGRP